MDVSEALQFFSEHHRAVLGTYRRDGFAQLTRVEGFALNTAGPTPAHGAACARMRASAHIGAGKQ